jgi:hypothetical protein
LICGSISVRDFLANEREKDCLWLDLRVARKIWQTLAARGATTPYRNNNAPVAAPANIVTIEASLVFHRGLAPPASEESEAKPVTVSVSTVVVMSGTKSFLTTALRTPIATPGSVRRLSHSLAFVA